MRMKDSLTNEVYQNTHHLQFEDCQKSKKGILRLIQGFLFLKENICCDPSLEPSRRDGSNGGSQYMFYGEMWLFIPKLSLLLLLIWSTAPTENVLNTGLNDLRIVVCLRKKIISIERMSGFNFIENLAEHGTNCLPCSDTNDVIDLLPQQQRAHINIKMTS